MTVSRVDLLCIIDHHMWNGQLEYQNITFQPYQSVSQISWNIFHYFERDS